MNRTSLRTASRQRGMTVVELLVVLAIIGIVANIALPGVMSEIVKTRAGSIIGEYRMVEQAFYSFWADAGEPPAPWTQKTEDPELAPYLRGHLVDTFEGLGLEKYFVRYADPNPDWGFQSGYLLASNRGDSPIIRAVERQFDGPMVVLEPGRKVMLVIERFSGDGGGGAPGDPGTSTGPNDPVTTPPVVTDPGDPGDPANQDEDRKKKEKEKKKEKKNKRKGGKDGRRNGRDGGL